jgi:hypothetical protein
MNRPTMMSATVILPGEGEPFQFGDVGGRFKIGGDATQERFVLYEAGPDGKEKAFRHVIETAKAIEAHSRRTEPDGLNEHLQGGLQ